MLPAFPVALEQVQRQLPDVLLVIAGEGPALDALHRQASRLGLSDNLMFVGYLDRATGLLDCYRSADVFVFASRTETQGLVLLEAMARGGEVVDDAPYPFGAEEDVLDPAPLFSAWSEDRAAGTDAGTMALRFHAGLARAFATRARALVEAGAAPGVLVALDDEGRQRVVAALEGVGVDLEQAVLVALDVLDILQVGRVEAQLGIQRQTGLIVLNHLLRLATADDIDASVSAVALDAVLGLRERLDAADSGDAGSRGHRRLAVLRIDAALPERREHCTTGIERDLALAREATQHDGNATELGGIRNGVATVGARAHAGTSPMIFTSCTSSTPCTSRTVLRTCSMSSSMSVAVAFSRLMMKFACFSDTSAPPIR